MRAVPAVLKRHTPSGRLPVSLSDDLLHGCPMFFPFHQQQYLTAFQQLEGVNKPGVTTCASCCAVRAIVTAVGDRVAAAGGWCLI